MLVRRELLHLQDLDKSSWHREVIVYNQGRRRHHLHQHEYRTLLDALQPHYTLLHFLGYGCIRVRRHLARSLQPQLLLQAFENLVDPL